MSRKILVSDLQRHTAGLREAIVAATTSVVDSAWFVHGKACSAFEQTFAAYCAVEHCIGVANGTDALELGLRALGVGPGARVATVANAGFYTSTALLAIGAHPVFIDVDPETHLMDLQHLAAVLNQDEISTVVITHLYGLMHDVEAVRRLCDEKNIRVLEDCAQAHGARRDGRPAGSVGHASTFSFYPTKNLGAIGDGGAVVTADAEVAARARLLRQYGWDRKYHVVAQGARNSRLDELQAAVLSVKLPHLDAWNARRRQIATRYSEGIRRKGVLCPALGGEEYVGHLYVLQCEDRNSLQAHLELAGIASDIHYPIPDHRQPAIAPLTQWPELPVTDRLASSVLSIPLYPELDDEEVDYVIKVINAW